MTFSNFLNPASLQGSWLTGFAIQSAALIVIALIAAFCLRRKSAALRHLTLSLAVFSLPLLLATSSFVPRWHLFAIPAAATPVAEPTQFDVSVEHQIVAASPSHSPAIAETKKPAELAPARPGFPFIFAAWLAGVGFIWFRLFAGTFSLRRLNGTPAGPELQRLLNLETEAMGVAPRKVLGETTEGWPPSGLIIRSGQRSKFEDADEFVYPTEYDPPLLPESSHHDPSKAVPKDQLVTPANPTAFDTRMVGLIWEIDPFIQPDGSVQLTIDIENSQFLGFINYGSQINGIITEAGKEKSVTLTDNRILQPIFSLSRVNTSLVVPPGKLVVINALSGREEKSVDRELQDAAAKPLAPRKSYLYVIEAKVVEK